MSRSGDLIEVTQISTGVRSIIQCIISKGSPDLCYEPFSSLNPWATTFFWCYDNQGAAISSLQLASAFMTCIMKTRYWSVVYSMAFHVSWPLEVEGTPCFDTLQEQCEALGCHWGLHRQAGSYSLVFRESKFSIFAAMTPIRTWRHENRIAHASSLRP